MVGWGGCLPGTCRPWALCPALLLVGGVTVQLPVPLFLLPLSISVFRLATTLGQELSPTS